MIRQVDNRGPGAGRNRGLAEVGTPWVAFLDSDMTPGPGWLERLTAISLESEPPDGVEGRVEVPPGAAPTPFTHTTEFSTVGTHHGAGNVAYQTAVLRGIGGFDERFFDPRRGVHFREDTELYFRMQAAGRRLRYEDQLVALHPPLESSRLAPIRLARRYYFDPLIAREHPAAFQALIETRRVGPVSLRRARHDAAKWMVAGLVLLGVAPVLRSRRVWATSVAVTASAWAANAAALAWGRRVRIADVPALAGVSLVTPVVYLWNHERGVRRFGYRPHY